MQYAVPVPALAGIRVVEIGDESGAYAGKLLAELGADVLKVEPPGGDPTRGIGPFLGGEPGLDRSLFFRYYNSHKRPAILDLGAPAGQEHLSRLLADADVLLVTGTPAVCNDRGLDYAALAARHPHLIVATVSPFGSSGPYREWKSCDLVAQAMGGMAFVNGHPDEPPLRGFGLQAYHSAGLQAAIGVLLALHARRSTGRGQAVDVSLQEAVAATVEHVSSSFHLGGTIEVRRGTLHWTRAFRGARCRDGYVLQTSLGDWTALVEWIKADGKAQDLDQPEWENYAHRQREHQHLFDVLDAWVRDYGVEELVESAQLRRIPYAPVRDLESLATHEQLVARGFLERIQSTEHRERTQNTDNRTQTESETRESSLGSESAAVYVLSSSLQGVRVLDFTWVVAGPLATRVLADHGAEVIKIERRDATDFGSRRAGLTGNLNRGKKSLVVNMSDPRGVELVRDLVRRSDVVIDNFSSRVMRNWELDYECLRRLNQRVVAVSLSGFGHTGPQKDYLSYGPSLQAQAGWTMRMRHRGGEPAGWGYSYADMIGGYSGALAVLAALWHRDRTEEGCFIDLSQLEALTAVVGVPLLEVLLNGSCTAPYGNRSLERQGAPYGIYRCSDRPEDAPAADRWCAICVFSDDDWRSFVAAIGTPSWTAQARFRSVADRLSHRDELDELVERWTSVRPAEEVMTTLQAAGVAAGIVANGRDLCLRDRQLAARGYWVTTPTPEGESATLDGIAVQLSATPGRIAAPAPLLGEHTDEVLRTLLDLDQAVIDRLRRDGVVA